MSKRTREQFYDDMAAIRKAERAVLKAAEKWEAAARENDRRIEAGDEDGFAEEGHLQVLQRAVARLRKLRGGK